MSMLAETARPLEEIFLGTLLSYPEEIADARDMLPVEALHWDCHQRIYRALIRMHGRRDTIDVISLRDELRTVGDAEDVKDELLGTLAGCTATAATLSSRIERIQGIAVQRQLALVAENLSAECESPTCRPLDLLEQTQAHLARLAEQSAITEAVPFSDVIHNLWTEIDARSRGERRAGTLTGFVQTDELLCGGLPTGGLTILAARPSVGKTSFAGHVARNVAGRGAAVLFVSLEQQQLELAERVVAGESRVGGKRIRTAQLEPRHLERLSGASDRMREWRLWINDRSGQSAGQIAAGARRTKRVAHGLDLIVVDYLNLVRPENPKVSRNEQIGASAVRLRDMARELGVPVLVLCQLNRAAVSDAEPPKLHHLRDSGEIEQTADVVLFLHRTTAWQPNMPDLIELHVAKHRNGPVGVVELEHESRVYTFRERMPV